MVVVVFSGTALLVAVRRAAVRARERSPLAAVMAGSSDGPGLLGVVTASRLLDRFLEAA